MHLHLEPEDTPRHHSSDAAHPFVFKAGFLRGPELKVKTKAGWPASLKDLPVSDSPELGLQVLVPHPDILCGFWGSNPGSHVCKVSIVLFQKLKTEVMQNFYRFF